jgi:tRNA(Ile2) C34 agmatinyltransferase TiaS
VSLRVDTGKIGNKNLGHLRRLSVSLSAIPCLAKVQTLAGRTCTLANMAVNTVAKVLHGASRQVLDSAHSLFGVSIVANVVIFATCQALDFRTSHAVR